jgi:hypothetical protein
VAAADASTPAPAAADDPPAADAPSPAAADAPAPSPPTPARPLTAPRPGRLDGDTTATTSEPNLAACQRAAAANAADSASGYRFCQAAAGCGDDVAKGTCDLIADAGEGGAIKVGAGWVSAMRKAPA